MTSVKISRAQRERVPQSLADGEAASTRAVKPKAISEKTKIIKQGAVLDN